MTQERDGIFIPDIADRDRSPVAAGGQNEGRGSFPASAAGRRAASRDGSRSGTGNVGGAGNGLVGLRGMGAGEIYSSF